jgi:hypothetical protein
MSFQILGSTMRNDSQPKPVPFFEGASPVEAAVDHIFNKEMRQIALDLIGFRAAFSEFTGPSADELREREALFRVKQN